MRALTYFILPLDDKIMQKSMQKFVKNTIQKGREYQF